MVTSNGGSLWWWPWARPKHDEPADVLACRLEKVADELESATAELRSLVVGVRAVKADREGSMFRGDES